MLASLNTPWSIVGKKTNHDRHDSKSSVVQVTERLKNKNWDWRGTCGHKRFVRSSSIQGKAFDNISISSDVIKDRISFGDLNDDNLVDFFLQFKINQVNNK